MFNSILTPFPKPLFQGLLVLLCISLSISCKKKEDEVIGNHPTAVYTKYSYEVNCNYCDILYTDASNVSKTIRNHTGDWRYQFPSKVTFELKLNIKTTSSSYQTISAYILKNDEAVYGKLGYNTANLSFNTETGYGNSSFGQYVNPSSGGGNGGGGTTTPVSSVCGAKNKSGGYCQRVVVGGGRCWQHK